MRTIFRTIICTVAVVLTAVSCQKYIEHSNLIKEGNGTIDISVNGLMGEYTQVDATKSSLVNNIRVCWEGGETVYVYDGTQCLGSLIATLEGEENRYALLSTDGSKHTIKKPAGGTAKLTLVHSPLLTEAPSVNNGVISVSLAQQSGATAPFVAYATLDYNGEESITNLVVAFKFATSVIRINCTGLKANTAITSATLSNVNTACKLTLSGTDAPTVAGEENGIITRTDDAYFAVNRINSEGEAVFQVTVPVLEKASEARVLALAQGSDNFEDKNFTTESLSAALSVNTVCQMVEKYEPSSDVLSGEFSVSTTKIVHFSKGNLQATINENGVPTAWKFAANQYDFLGEGGANETIGTQAGDVDLFGWSTASTYYGISISVDDKNYSGDFVDWGKAIGDGSTWRTLSIGEWKYLLENRTNASDKFGLATVAGYHGIIILPSML